MQAVSTCRADRKASRDLADIPIPTGREEAWRFTPVDLFLPLLQDPLEGKGISVEVTGQSLTQGLTYRPITGLGVALYPANTQQIPLVSEPSDRGAVIASNSTQPVLHLIVDEGARVNEPLEVNLHASDSAPTSNQIRVQAAANSQATIVLRHTGNACLTQEIEVDVAQGANLTLVSLQEWDKGTIHASNHRIRVGQDASLKHVVVTLGGQAVRLTPEVTFAEPGGRADLIGIYFATGGQHQEHRPFINHAAPDAFSRVTYKGALHGRDTHSVWVGDVLIGLDGYGTDTYELNRNLVLGLGPIADSVPNLEIQNGQIQGAGHASATGRFDDEQLFYLCSRGISIEQARRLVLEGFFAQMVDQIGVETINREVLSQIEAKILGLGGDG